MIRINLTLHDLQHGKKVLDQVEDFVAAQKESVAEKTITVRPKSAQYYGSYEISVKTSETFTI